MFGNTQVYWIHLKSHTDILSEGYVGVSNNSKLRLWDHNNDAKKSKHVNPHLSRALTKYKDEIVQTIIFVGDEDICFQLEEELRPEKNIAWNINKGGFCPPSRKGIPLTEEHKKSISKSNTGKKHPHTEEHKKKLSDALSGREFTEEHKKKIKDKRKDQKFTKATRKKLSESHKGKTPSNAKQVKTPLGTFKSLTEAAKSHNVVTQTMINWVESGSPSKSDFAFI